MPIMLRDCISRNWGYIVIVCTESSAVFVKIAPKIVQGEKLASCFIQINKFYLDLFKAINNIRVS